VVVFSGSESFKVSLYMYHRWRSSYQEDLDFQHHITWSYYFVFSELWWKGIFRFFDIGGIVDLHCFEVYLSGAPEFTPAGFLGVRVAQAFLCVWCIVDHCLWKESLNSDGEQCHQYQQNEQWPRNSEGQQFHQYQKIEKSLFKVGSSCSTRNTCRVSLVTNPVIGHV
jgi:hypothetical protein